jgi:TatD DNase family protein
MLIDTHTHLYLNNFSDDRDRVIERALKKDVLKMLLPNIDSGTIDPLHQLAVKFGEHCYPMMGLHPTSVRENYLEELRKIEMTLRDGNYIGIGETGMDLYWDTTFKEEQEESLSIQINWAKEMNLPLVLHTRNAFKEIFRVMDKKWEKGLNGVFHSFSGNLEEAERIMDYGFYIGINGIITFKNNDIEDVISEIPPQHIILETDAPFLSPVPYRGKRNESSYLVHIAEKISKIYKLSFEEIAEITTSNALNLFNRIDQ